MKTSTFLSTLHDLGITPSFSQPSVSNDNSYSEALFKTTKYCHFYLNKPFNALERARNWICNFVNWYNNEHLHSGIKFITPNDRHQGLSISISKNRSDVYLKAKSKNPNRWSGNIRNWSIPKEVHLNLSLQIRNQ